MTDEEYNYDANERFLETQRELALTKNSVDVLKELVDVIVKNDYGNIDEKRVAELKKIFIVLNNVNTESLKVEGDDLWKRLLRTHDFLTAPLSPIVPPFLKDLK